MSAVARTPRALVVFAVAAAALGATAAPAAAVGSGSDQEIADAGVLTQSDLPSGWSIVGPASDDADDTGLPECRVFEKARRQAKKTAALANSPEFGDATSTFENAVYVFPNAKGATKFVKVSEKTLTDCVQATFEGEVDSQPIKVENVEITADLGDQAIGIQAIIGDPESPDAVFQSVGVRVGRAFTGVTLATEGANLPAIGPDQIRAVVDRLEAALG